MQVHYIYTAEVRSCIWRKYLTTTYIHNYVYTIITCSSWSILCWALGLLITFLTIRKTYIPHFRICILFMVELLMAAYFLEEVTLIMMISWIALNKCAGVYITLKHKMIVVAETHHWFLLIQSVIGTNHLVDGNDLCLSTHTHIHVHKSVSVVHAKSSYEIADYYHSAPFQTHSIMLHILQYIDISMYHSIS